MGVDASTVSHDAAVKFEDALAKRKLKLTLLNEHLVDQVWKDRPAKDLHEIFPLPISFSGRESSDKIASLKKYLETNNLYAFIITALDEVACKSAFHSSALTTPFRAL